MDSSSVFENNETLRYVLRLFERTIFNHGLVISCLQVAPKPGAVSVTKFTDEQKQMLEHLVTLARLPPFMPPVDNQRPQTRNEYRDAYVERASNLFCKILSTLDHNLLDMSLGEHPHHSYAEAAPSLPPAPRLMPYDTQRRPTRTETDALSFRASPPYVAPSAFLPDAVFPRHAAAQGYPDISPPVHKVEQVDRARRTLSPPYANEPLRRRRSREEPLSYQQGSRLGDVAPCDGVYNSFAVSRKDFRENPKYDAIRSVPNPGAASRQIMPPAQHVEWMSPTAASSGQLSQRRTQKRNQMQKGEDKAERACANCKTSDTRQWVRGKENWLCHSCGQFWRKNGYSRPRALWNRPTFKRAPRKGSNRGTSASKPRKVAQTDATRLPTLPIDHRFVGPSSGSKDDSHLGGKQHGLPDASLSFPTQAQACAVIDSDARNVDEATREPQLTHTALDQQHTSGQETYPTGEASGVEGVPPLSGLFYSAAMMRSNTT